MTTTIVMTLAMTMIMLMIKRVIVTKSDRHNGIFHKKIHVSLTNGFLEILLGWGAQSYGNPGRKGVEPKKSSFEII